MSRFPTLINVIFALVAMLVFATSVTAQGKMEYGSVAQARQALLAKPGAEVEHKGGWLIIGVREQNSMVWWSFPPSGHEANPAVAKRYIVEKDGTLSIETRILCEATKAACDRLVETYGALDARMKDAFKKGQ